MANESEVSQNLVNKNVFPLSLEVWESMWNRINQLHPDSANIIESIRGKATLKVPLPQQPILKPSHTVSEKLELIQKYMSELQYDYTGTQFFEIKKGRPLCRLMDVAKTIIKESLPIKCLEAVILSLYLTSEIPSVQRFPISFKSSFQGTVHKHIILGVQYSGKYGALGLSRRSTLMYKELNFESLHDLLQEFIKCYEECYHRVHRIKLGLPVTHDCQSMESVIWKFVVLKPDNDFKDRCDTFAKQLRRKTSFHMKYIADLDHNSSLSDAESSKMLKRQKTVTKRKHSS